jgi:hypothetical protein
MSVPLFRTVTLSFAVLVLAADATASARPKKDRTERAPTLTTA